MGRYGLVGLEVHPLLPDLKALPGALGDEALSCLLGRARAGFSPGLEALR